jgi:glutamyl-tRNA synthetase
MSQVRTRFAPSPTGHLHLGGARTALFNWLLARGRGGVFILRIEDTDLERSTEESTRAILEAMEWLSMDFDEGPYFQSERTAVHLEYIQKLLNLGRAYYCHCQPEELDALREEAMRQGRKPKYDGRCRDKGLGPAPGAVVRFRGPLTGSTGWNDLIKGPLVYDHEELDDLVLLKSDGTPTYNLAVVADDIDMGITHVIRGDGHVNNTPRQILLYQALEAPLPEFGHVPIVLGEDRTRLSKRHGATSVMAYKEMGYLPEALVNYLARLGWSHGDEEIFRPEELIEKFDLAHVGKSAGVFNLDKLTWLNAHYIKEASPARLAGLLVPFLNARGLASPDLDYLAQAVVALQPRAKTLVELAEKVAFYLVDDVVLDPAAAKKFLTADVIPVLKELMEKLQPMEAFSEKGLETLFEELAAAHGVKLGKIAQPVRVALTGTSVSPGLFEVVNVLGKARVLGRLSKALSYLEAQAEAD